MKDIKLKRTLNRNDLSNDATTHTQNVEPRISFSNSFQLNFCIEILDEFDNAEDAEIEKKRIKEEKTDPIYVYGLSKTYDNNFRAVKDLSFGVQKKQIFGLLGPNGAGKSTTFNVLTRFLSKSRGTVKFSQQNIEQNLIDFYLPIGACPQNDCVWDLLTPKEHLNFFGRISGFQDPELSFLVSNYLQAFNIDIFQNVLACKLSGGNRRKLCVANSIIGHSSLLFFDEPSTGLDPFSKRGL